MRVLMISGDKSFGPGNLRYELQKTAVERLEVIYWGRGSLWPKIPEGQFDVVTAQDPFWRGLLAWVIARRAGLRLNIQVHVDLAGQPIWRRLVAGFMLVRADSIRVVSDRIKQQIGVKKPVTVLPVYIDVERFTKVVRRPTRTILWIGRFETEKDPVLALEIAKKVPDAKMIMLGSGGLAASLRRQAGPNIEFPGWQDITPYLASAGVVLCTSKHESFGASIIEALAAGVPVVAPDVGVAREAGAIVVERDKLAGAIIKVLRESPRGQLKLKLLSKEEWGRRWKDSL